ncbi:MAG: hypothetical protein RQ757_10005 [Pseudomonadales bacterium]|nr:hypothetical protein [Pseudomonadales bacterium]
MVKLFVLTMLAIFAGLLLAVSMAGEPGYILIVYGNTTFETSLFALLVALLLILLILKLVFLLFGWLNPARWFHRR